MKFDDVKCIFYRHIHRRYHRFCRELFSQLICINLNIKPAYLFDLFPFSIQAMRSLLNDLSFCFIILKYSLNDLVIMNRSQLATLINPSRSVLIIDLNTMNTTDHHSMLDKIREHLSWIDTQSNEKLDFDNEIDDEWSQIIQSLNHTTVFGYILGYPIIYFYKFEPLMTVITLRNFRLYVKLHDNNETLLYSFSCPLHSNIDKEQIDSIVNNGFFSALSTLMNEKQMIESYRFDSQINEQSAWCL